jgi:TolB-like protein/DNA-binding winged helix-turn-helix (wHTH) protein/Flp pilus assembly protein TadD
MPAQDPEQIIRFGDFELDLRAGELRRGGIRLPVQGRPVQTLAILLRNPGQLVTREELHAELWHADTFVDFEHGLHNAVARLRAVLGDTANTPRFIETLARRGYRFVAAVGPAPASTRVQEPAPEPPAAQTGPAAPDLTKGPEEPSPPAKDLEGDPLGLPLPGRRLWTQRFEPPTARLASSIALVVIVAALVLWKVVPGWRERLGNRANAERIGSLAVLPLQNLSDDPEQEYFADGMTDALITDLAKIKALRVVSRTSVLRYKGSKKTTPEIANELNVQAVLEGTVERAGERVRISARLIRAATDQPVWAESYDQDLRDVLRLQDDVARSIAREIQIEITPNERARLNSPRVDAEAYEFYLKGRYFWLKRTRDSVHKAIEYFNRAIEKDPGYAAAYSGLADCYSSLGFSFDVGDMAPNDVQPKAIAAAQRAIALNDSLAEAHTSLGFIRLNYQWDWPGAETEFRRALALNSGVANAHHWYAHYLMVAGRTQEAEAESRRALELDPLSPIMNVHLGWHYFYAHQYDQALDQFHKTLELDPNYGLAYWYRGLAYEQRGMYAEAIRELRKGSELLEGNTVIYSDLGHAYAMAGNRGGATSILAELKQLRTRTYVSHFGIALLCIGLGLKDQAFASLEQAYRERSDMLIYLNVDPRLDPLRSDPRFTALAHEIGIPK